MALAQYLTVLMWCTASSVYKREYSEAHPHQPESSQPRSAPTWMAQRYEIVSFLAVLDLRGMWVCNMGKQWPLASSPCWDVIEVHNGDQLIFSRKLPENTALGFKTIVTLRLSSLVCFDIEVGEGLWCQVFHTWGHLWIHCTRHSCIFGTACLSCFVWWHNIIIHPDVARYI